MEYEKQLIFIFNWDKDNQRVVDSINQTIVFSGAVMQFFRNRLSRIINYLINGFMFGLGNFGLGNSKAIEAKYMK